MTTPDDNQPENHADEPTVAFVVQTPFGSFTDADDLPPELRDGLLKLLENEDVPPMLRTLLATALGVDNANEATPAAAEANGHAPDCDCVDAHRENVWAILDRAFPNDPHLWQAMEALFALSAANPTEIDEEARQGQLEAATRHLQRHAALSASPQSPVDQLITRFRAQLDGM